MEKIFLPERCSKLASAGCVCLSFGMESGNQRILDLIDKGTKIHHMRETMKNFAEAGIAVQLMAFNGFPTETPAELQDTVRFVTETDEYWATGGIGTFLLTGNAIVARNPERFGIKTVETQNVDVGRAVAFRMESQESASTMSTEEIDASFDHRGDIFPQVLGRPWAGGTDTLHSMIYYEHYGKKFFKERGRNQTGGTGERPHKLEILDCVVRVTGKISALPFDLSRMLSHRKDHKRHVQKLREQPIEPTYTELLHWQETVPKIARLLNADEIWIWNGTKCMKLDAAVHEFLLRATETGQPVRELLRYEEEITAERLLEFLRRLQATGLVHLETLQSNEYGKIPADFAECDSMLLVS
jgi:hypothetical protein